MMRTTHNLFFLFVILILFGACSETPPKNDKTTPATGTSLEGPEERFGDLFQAVQMASIFPDSKTFADCTPKTDDATILERYEAQKGQPDFSIEAFVEANFERPHSFSSNFVADTSGSVKAHIEKLWPVLTRQPDHSSTGTLIPLPNEYVVPGGRFGEIYYWDSYFTMLGLQVSDNSQPMVRKMVDNFSYLIETVGFIPNGNRTYYLGRSQPPFFALMVELLAEIEGDSILVRYLPSLEKEYAFWMSGQKNLTPENPTAKHTVLLPGGEIVNRYWDEKAEPRPESFREDVILVEETEREAEAVYRDLRSACESGWDFSTRWFADAQNLSTIRTTEIIPVDLNCLLYQLETTLARAYQVAGQIESQAHFTESAEKRRNAILTYNWDKEKGHFVDYDFVNKTATDVPSLAMMFPLFMKIATDEQAASVKAVIENSFLQPGGVVTTLNRSGQQWDAPNGWAPLQWVTIKGLRNYGHDDLADKIKTRWVRLNTEVFKRTGKLVEKYNVMDSGLEAGGGEYPNQDGFGWTNGVLLRLLSE